MDLSWPLPTPPNRTFVVNERDEKTSIYLATTKAFCASALLLEVASVLLPAGNYSFEDQQYQASVSGFLITDQQVIKSKNQTFAGK